MILTTHNSDAVVLVPHAPAWRRPLELRVSVPSERSRSLTGREFRRPLGASLRCWMRWQSLIEAPRINAMRDVLREYDDEPVYVPAWPFATRGTDWPGEIDGGVTVGWMDDWSSFAIDPATPSDWDWVAPVLVGRVDVTLPSLLAPRAAEVTFALSEDSTADAGLIVGVGTWDAGPELNDTSTPPLFPLDVDWSRAPGSSAPAIEISRRSVGRAPRVRMSARYPHTGALTIDGSVTCPSWESVAALLRWWSDMGGDAGTHYVSTLADVGRLAADADASDTSIELESALDIGDYRFLALTDADRTQIVRVSSIASNVLTLSAGLAHAVSASRTVVSVAILARHSGGDVDLTFEAPDFARARLSWQEVTEEYAIAIGESRGETIGAASIRATLFRITVNRAGSETVYLQTSYERDLDVGADTWLATAIDYSRISRGIRLDRDETTIDCRVAPWCDEFLPGRLTGRVLVEIFECDVSGDTGSNVEQIWSGEITSVSFDGPFVRATARGPYSVFDRPIPRLTMQPGCNHSVYDSLCGLDVEDWTWVATRVTHSGQLLTVGSLVPPSGAADWGFENYFALGILVRGTERFRIFESTLLSSGQITLRLDRPADWDDEEEVLLIPGCDGQVNTCRAFHAGTNPGGKFDNFSNFGGFPSIPSGNPAFTPPRRTDNASGKK